MRAIIFNSTSSTGTRTVYIHSWHMLQHGVGQYMPTESVVDCGPARLQGYGEASDVVPGLKELTV